MGLVDFPDPASWYTEVKNGSLERAAANAFVSSQLSAYISFLWNSGASKWAQYIGEGKALQAAATAMYLSLSKLEAKNFLVLTVPTEMLSPENLSKYQSEWRTK